MATADQAPKAYYPILMCESAPVAAFGHASASVAGVALKMPVANPRRILVIGDTGCRVATATSGTQACNDPAQFPLEFLSNYAATFKPDLIVHTGDFFYREQPCPAGRRADDPGDRAAVLAGAGPPGARPPALVRVVRR